MKSIFTLISLSLLLALIPTNILQSSEVEMNAMVGLENTLPTAFINTGNGVNANTPAASGTYMVVSGDSLFLIAERLLGDGERWPEIFAANKDKIRDPHWIYPGQTFNIPGGNVPTQTTTSSEPQNTAATATADSRATQALGDKPFNKVLPCPKGTYSITSRFGMRKHPITGLNKMHNGIDLGAPLGTPVHATGAGTVILASEGENGGYGNLVKIRHDDGTVTLYAHLQASSLKVRPNQRVEAGAQIAGVNTTGTSTGNHLHFEVRLGGTDPKDPARFFPF